MSSALETSPLATSFFLSRETNLERSQSPWGPALAAEPGPPAPVLTAALANPTGRGAAGGFPVAMAAEPGAPLEEPFFTISTAAARWTLFLWAQELRAAMARRRMQRQ